MGTEVAVQETAQVLDLRQQLEDKLIRNSDSLMAALGQDQQQVARWKSLLFSAVNKNPELAACEPGSIIASMLEAAQFGLEFGAKQHSYLVPFKGKCTFLPSYRGLIHAAKRSGETKHIYAEAVYEKDQFSYTLGMDKRIEQHTPALGLRGKLVAVYAVVKFTDGSSDFEVMILDQLEHIKAKSASVKGPWATDYDEMAKKTVIKRLCKRLDLSSELTTLANYGETYETIQQAPVMEMPKEITQ